MKKLLIVLLALLLVAGLAACGDNDEAPAETTETAETPAETTNGDDNQEQQDTQEAPAQTGDTILIGVSQAFTDEFNTNLRNTFENYVAGIDGVDIVFANANGSVAQQVTDVENLIAQGVDVIVFRAVEGDAAGAAMDAVTNAGIYLVVDETPVPEGSEFDARIVGEQLDHGRMLGEFLAGLIAAGEIDDARIGYIAGSASAFALGRKNGITETLPSATFVAGGEEGFMLAEGWNATLAQEIVEGWIASGLIDEMNVIATMNDELANGAIAALAGNFPDMIILGVDGSELGQHNLRNGTMRATTFQDIRLSVSAIIDTSIRLVRGEGVNFDDVEYKLVNPRHLAIMTVDNIDELIG